MRRWQRVVFLGVMCASVVCCGYQQDRKTMLASEEIPAPQRKEEEKRTWVKPVVFYGGIAVVAIGGYKLWRFLDYELGKIFHTRYFNSNMKLGHGVRAYAGEGARKTIDAPPLYKLTNLADGSEHYLLGTMHTTAVSLHDFPKNSVVFKALDETTVFMPELVMSFSQYRKQVASFKWKNNVLAKAMRKIGKYKPQNYSLRERLGDEHWVKLEKMFAAKPESIPPTKTLAEFMQELDRSDPEDAISLIMEQGQYHAIGPSLTSIDLQLTALSWEKGKKVIGLETLKDRRIAQRSQGLDISMTTHELQKLIDKGGIDYVKDTTLAMRDAYAAGDLAELEKQGKFFADLQPKLRRALLDERNKKWVASGKVQKNCRRGKKCMIAVGAAHLEEGENSLFRLLRADNFKIEKVEHTP